jgi:hypothetical protein
VGRRLHTFSGSNVTLAFRFSELICRLL